MRRFRPKIKDDCPGIKRPLKKRKLNLKDIALISAGILYGGMIVGIIWLISL